MQTILLILEIFLAFCNACIMLALFKAFLMRPHNNLEDRVKTLEVKVQEINDSLHHGNDQFRSQREMNEVFINCMLAFLDFEIAYCQHTGYEYSDDIMRARSVLQGYLARK